VEEFRIPDPWLQHRVTGRSPDGTVRYTKHREVDTRKFLSKLDAVLTYFALRQEKREVGFAAHSK